MQVIKCTQSHAILNLYSTKCIFFGGGGKRQTREAAINSIIYTVPFIDHIALMHSALFLTQFMVPQP